MVTSKEINKNITLNFIPMVKLKTTSVGIYIHCPISNETATCNALLSGIMKQGSKKYPTRACLIKRLDELYGSTIASGVSKKGEDHVLSFEAECIRDKYTKNGEKLLEDVIGVLVEIIFNPDIENGAFKEDVFLSEKKNLFDKIKAEINDKRVYAAERISEITSKGTPYSVSRLGDIDTLSKVTAKSLCDYYNKMITSSMIDIYIAGDADFESVYKSLLEKFNNFDFNNSKIPETSILNETEKTEEVIENMDVTQGKLAMSFTTKTGPKDDDIWALIVWNSIFGGGAHSKLFNNVREKLSLAYYAGSQMHKFKGFILVNAGVEFSNMDKAKDEVLLQLDEMRKGNIKVEEIKAAKMALINSANSYYDDQMYIQSFYLGEKIAGTNYDIEYYKEKISEVTIDDVKKISEKINLHSIYKLLGKEVK